ncbi:cbb3-type cytochrome oxidase assembly protein CcoS [Microbulbifer sp. SAOS-129_SWC]|uniref:cbb3-type cytochrome oxidase assembly protein CcoS n=1 Tax=Microbulbifer sp. SAOS-129_SWC TaxID=3145235 RepID=UPI0032173056
MDSLYILIPIAIVFIGSAVKLFFWAVNNGQYDDLDTEGRRILFDDDVPPPGGDAGAEQTDADGAPDSATDSENSGGCQ